MADPPEREEVQSVLDVAVTLAEVLVACGSGAEDAASTMSMVADAYGLDGTDSDITFTMLTLTWTDPLSHESISRRQTVRQRGLDYSRLTSAARLTTEIKSGTLPLGEARIRLAEVASRPSPFPHLVRRLGWAVLGGGAAFLLGGSAWIAGVAFVATGLLDWVIAAVSAHGAPPFYQCLLGGCVGPMAAAVAHFVDPSSSAWLVTVATIIMLLAGVTTLAAVQDLLSGLYVTGLARLTEAVVITVGIASGVVGASRALQSLGVALDFAADVGASPSGLWRAVLAAATVSAGFALATQVPLRAFWAVAALGGCRSWFTFWGSAVLWGPYGPPQGRRCSSERCRRC
jgi:uncharacterized membrane protein YjjP (DUF1212 family)